METQSVSQYNIGHGRHFKPIPVYAYPEHLNPFYEDENHKRLRFWSISRKGKDGKEKSSSTWSINSLRDIWGFKSFRVKKRSSTLGINKTSESPPVLRKDFYDDNFNTYGMHSRCRQTLNGSTNEVFERNTPYRASTGGLRSNKNYDTQSEILFNRNDTYRSTVQHVPSKQRNNSSVTPLALKKRFGYSSSQTSVHSTNPFEDDDDASESVTETPKQSISLSESSTARRNRKKRKAPPPPTTGKLVFDVREESSPPDNVELRIVEDTSPNSTQTTELPSISSLTAEIETLVKSVEEDTDDLVRQVHSENIQESTKEMAPEMKKVIEKKSQVTEEPHEVKRVEIRVNDSVLVDSKNTEPDTKNYSDKNKETEEVEVIPVEKVVIKEIVTEGKMKDIQVINVSTDSTVTLQNTNTNSVPEHLEEPVNEEKVIQSIENTKHSQVVETSDNLNTNDLKIIEDDESNVNGSPGQAALKSFEIKYRSLNDVKTKSTRVFEQRKREKEHQAWRAELCRSNSLEDDVKIRSNDVDGSGYHGERRRSVKEIIEAINKNQSLLQGTNYSPLNGKYDYNEHPNLKAQRELETNQTNLESQLELDVKNNERCFSYYDNVPDMLQNLDKQSQSFEKCSTKRESSPSFEWNPVPKPARKSQSFTDSNNLNNVD